MRTNKGERKTELKEGREERRAKVDNNTSMAPKLTENLGVTTRPVTTLQMAALEMVLISSSAGRGHDPPPNASNWLEVMPDQCLYCRAYYEALYLNTP